ncbi:MAG: rod shape-determining protein [Candidatus Omnitrophica bacterium]|nr:rod shape-determining protein [Candidatus Omnitrophota bacterium]
MITEKKIQQKFKKDYNLAVGEKTAEDLKVTINKFSKAKMKVTGRSYETGRKKTVSILVTDLIK